MNGFILRAALFPCPAFIILACLSFLFLVGCQPQGGATRTVEPALIQPATITPVPTIPSAPALPQAPALTSIPTSALPELPPSPSPIPEHKPDLKVCSPLEGVPIDLLEERISNPFNPPPPGSDDPHQGVDLSDTGAGGVAREGLQVNSVLPGKIAAVIQERFPYGNAVLVETSLDSLPPEWLRRLPLPGGEITSTRTTLTCPEASFELAWDGEFSSLYFLYAHLQLPPAFQPGDEIACGQMVGLIGSSGNALNPHLHLELRAGPANARFASMAHYDPSASPDEMAAYCSWRVSGQFALLDPMSLFFFP
jgi:murein DD-endopeptidase MepM/ murein hydrolase activator NlpD